MSDTGPTTADPTAAPATDVFYSLLARMRARPPLGSGDSTEERLAQVETQLTDLLSAFSILTRAVIGLSDETEQTLNTIVQMLEQRPGARGEPREASRIITLDHI